MASKKKQKKKAASSRGEHILLKADIDAFVEGKPSPRARRNRKIVDRAFRLTERLRKVEEQRNERIMADCEPFMSDESGVTINDPEGERRVIIKRNTSVVGNENAERAAQIINEYYDLVVVSEDFDDDTRNFLSFLKGVISRNRAGIKFTSSVARFNEMRFKHPILKEAQKLLRNGFESKTHAPRIVVQELHGEEWETI